MSLDDVDVELGSPREGEALTQAQLDLLYRDGFIVCVLFPSCAPLPTLRPPLCCAAAAARVPLRGCR